MSSTRSSTSGARAMIKPRPVDRLEVHILVDNATDSLSSVPSHVETEFAYLNRKGMRILSGKCICCANHGLSCLITAHRDGVAHTVLFETGLPLHFAKTETGWEPDPWIVDERWLGVNVAGKGVIVFTACSHAGVVNVLKDARARFAGVPLYCVLGGLHLSGPTEKIIPDTVQAMREFELSHIAAGHCTGWRAMTALVSALGDKSGTLTAV